MFPTAKVNSANSSNRAALETIGSNAPATPKDISQDSNDSAMCLSYENSPFINRSTPQEVIEAVAQSSNTASRITSRSLGKPQSEAGPSENEAGGQSEAEGQNEAASQNEGEREEESSSSSSDDGEASQTTEASEEGVRVKRKRKRGRIDDDIELVARPPEPK